jgi:hypothetical protein
MISDEWREISTPQFSVDLVIAFVMTEFSAWPKLEQQWRMN